MMKRGIIEGDISCLIMEKLYEAIMEETWCEDCRMVHEDDCPLGFDMEDDRCPRYRHYHDIEDAVEQFAHIIVEACLR